MKVAITLQDGKGKSYYGEFDLALIKSKRNINRKPKKELVPSIKPSALIGGLYRKGFFKIERKLKDVESELNNSDYHFAKGSILMALKGASYLNKRGPKGSYRFIQKFPPK